MDSKQGELVPCGWCGNLPSIDRNIFASCVTNGCTNTGWVLVDNWQNQWWVKRVSALELEMGEALEIIRGLLPWAFGTHQFIKSKKAYENAEAFLARDRDEKETH